METQSNKLIYLFFGIGITLTLLGWLYPSNAQTDITAILNRDTSVILDTMATGTISDQSNTSLLLGKLKAIEIQLTRIENKIK